MSKIVEMDSRNAPAQVTPTDRFRHADDVWSVVAAAVRYVQAIEASDDGAITPAYEALAYEVRGLSPELRRRLGGR